MIRSRSVGPVHPAFCRTSRSAWMPHSMEYSGSLIVPGPLGNRVLYPLSDACMGSLPRPPDSCIITARISST